MKAKKTLLTVAAFGIALMAGVAIAGVGGTDHDFTSELWNASGEKCLPCHIPHHADLSIEAPLWNHAYPDGSAFTTWPGATLGAESLACLGCHDGQTALDSFSGQTGSIVMTGHNVVGSDLTDDHPVGVEYGTSTRRAPVGTIWGSQPGIPVGFGGLPLFGPDNAIECATCHTPHDNVPGREPFLRVATAGSALCVACHTAHD
jgi:predicted CXXCH cytochrome family protein